MNNNAKRDAKAILKFEVKGNGIEARDKRTIQGNLKMVKYPTGQLKTLQNKNSGMFQLLKTVNVLAFYQGHTNVVKGALAFETSAQGLYRACGKQFIMNHNINSVRNLLNLLCIAGAIKALSWDDLTKEVRHKSKRKAYYQVLDLQKADFSRIKGMDSNTKLNYAAVVMCYGKTVAKNTFSDMRTNTERQSFNELGLEHFTNEITNRGVVTLQEAVALFKETQPAFDYKDKWFIFSLKALFDMRYFKGRLKLTTYAKSRATGLNVTGNTKVIEPVKSYAETCF